MNRTKIFLPSRRRSFAAGAFLVCVFALFVGRSHLLGQNKSDFPDGYDGVQVAPNSHHVLFENAIVRVLEVTVPPGTKEPMHHHRWPSLFLYWDTGGRTAHQRYYRADGTVRDNPSRERPITEGRWVVKWMEPEPMHSVENAETAESALTLPKKPPTVRVEFKIHP
jgi:predicted metal-dependent enzyme (double-stranded beta helix superfamily)